MMSPANPNFQLMTEVDLTPTLGPLYWGFLVSLLMTGINVLQAWVYFPAHDKAFVQTVAASMLLLNIASSALVAQSVYYYLVPHFGSLVPLQKITSGLSAECMISTTITLISQAYFVLLLYNVARLRHQPIYIPICVGLFMILAFVFGTACTTVMIIHDHSVLSDRSDIFSVCFGLAKGFGALTDITATVAMCVSLENSRVQMGERNSAVKNLIHYLVRRGILVTLIQTLLLLTFHAAPARLYWLAFHVNVTRLYSNTFFAMLNGREHKSQRRRIGRDRNLAWRDSIPRLLPQAPIHIGRTPQRYGDDNILEIQDEQLGEDTKTFELPIQSLGSAVMPTVTKTVVIAQR